MPLYDYLTPKLDFKRKFNHRQSFLYKGRLTVRTIRKFRIGSSLRIESRIGSSIRNRIESRSFAGPYLKSIVGYCSHMTNKNTSFICPVKLCEVHQNRISLLACPEGEAWEGGIHCPCMSHIYSIWLLYAQAPNWKKSEQHPKAWDQSWGCTAGPYSQLGCYVPRWPTTSRTSD